MVESLPAGPGSFFTDMDPGPNTSGCDQQDTEPVQEGQNPVYLSRFGVQTHPVISDDGVQDQCGNVILYLSTDICV